MIKWLKKLYIGLLIGLPILLVNISNAYTNTFYPNVPGTISDWKGNIFTLRNNVNFTLNTTDWLISTYGGWTYPRLTNLFRTENWLYAVISCQGGYDCSNINTSIKTQWYVKQAKLCNYNATTSCNSNDTNLVLSSFYTDSTYSSPDFMTLSDTQWNNSNVYYCFKYESLNKQVCLIISDWFSTTWSSLGITYNPWPSQLGTSDDQISQYMTSSPFTPSTPSTPVYDDYITTPISSWDIVDYFEENSFYNFNRDMCYVWTTDLSSNYESWIVYYQGSGYNLFQLYSQFYWNTYKLSDLATFMNAWYVNFDTFFFWNNRYSNWDVRYVLRYNWIWNLVIDRNNLTNPFLNNKAVYYFMGSTACDNTSYYSCTEFAEELAMYCYNELWINDSRITYNPNKNIQENVVNYTNNKKVGSWTNLGWVFNNSWWVSTIDSASFHWTAFDYFTWDEWVSDFQSFFDKSFNKFKVSFWDITQSDLWLGVLPNYLVMFLLALILFRFISH